MRISEEHHSLWPDIQFPQVHFSLSDLPAEGISWFVCPNPTNIQLQVRLETMAESTNALPVLPHNQKISQLVPGSRLEDKPGEGETPDNMTGGNPKSGVWLTSEGAISSHKLETLQHLSQCHCCLTSCPTPAWPQSGLTPRVQWLTKEEWSSYLLSQKLNPGLAWHKNSLKRPWSHLSIHAFPQPWNRDDKSVTDYTPLHSCKISCGMQNLCSVF